MIYRLLIIFVLFISCNKKKTKKYSTKESDFDSIQKLSYNDEVEEDTTTIPFSKSLDGNGYFYQLEGTKNANGSINFKSINIFYKRELHQKIIIDTVSVLSEAEAYFDVNKDVNFDGYNDLEVINQVGNYWSSSSFWLYNKKTKKYDYYKPMDTIINPLVDKKNKAITSNYHIGPTDYYYKVYEWKNNKLIMTHFQADESQP